MIYYKTDVAHIDSLGAAVSRHLYFSGMLV